MLSFRGASRTDRRGPVCQPDRKPGNEDAEMRMMQIFGVSVDENAQSLAPCSCGIDCFDAEKC